MVEASDSGRTNRISSGYASLRERVREAARRAEAEMIVAALQQHRWNRRRTAAALSISYRSLMYKMKSFDLRNEDPGEKAQAEMR